MKTLPIRQRQYLHIVENLIDRGLPLDAAERIAAATVNKTRARYSRQRRGPKLIGRGGSRKQWYPGKKVAKRKWYCLMHKKKFKSKAGLKSHYRAHRRRR